MSRYIMLAILVIAGCKKHEPLPEPVKEKKWIVTTIAGNGMASFVNGPSLSATFHFPEDVVVVSENIYVTDVLNFCIRKISHGEVSTFAGGSGFDIVNGNGTAAKFKNPYSIGVDSDNNIYTTDENDSRIRKITPNGEVSTFTSAETPGNSITFDKHDNLYLVEGRNNRVRRISPDGEVTTIAGSGIAGFKEGNGTNAQFSSPGAIAIDKSDNLYIVDRGNLRIRKITPSGDVSTIAGNGTQGFKDTIANEAQFSLDLHDIVVDNEGNLYLQDTDRIRKLSEGGIVSTIAGSSGGYEDGEGSSAKFNFPAGMDIDSHGNIYIADLNNNRIRKLSFE